MVEAKEEEAEEEEEEEVVRQVGEMRETRTEKTKKRKFLSRQEGFKALRFEGEDRIGQQERRVVCFMKCNGTRLRRTDGGWRGAGAKCEGKQI